MRIVPIRELERWLEEHTIAPEEASMTDDRHLAAMARLYEAVMDSPVTDHAVDFLARARLLTNIAGDDFDAGRAVIHHPEGHGAARREYGALSEDARKDMLREVFAHWSLNCNLAVRQFWHTASVLGFPSRHARPEAHHARRRDLPVPPSADVAAELQKATGDD